MAIKDKLVKTLDKINTQTLEFPGALFYEIFETPCTCYKVYIDNEGEVKYCDSVEYFETIQKGLKNEIDTRYFVKKMKETSGVYVISIADYDHFIVGTTVPFLIITSVHNLEHDSDKYIYMYSSPQQIDDFIMKFRTCFKPVEGKQLLDFGIATFNGNYIGTQYYEYKSQNIDIDLNYNDEFKPVYDKVCNVIERENETGLILFYGEPGTGKSSVIKNLISKYPETEFVFIDGTLLSSATQNSLVSYFIENENTVFILEDCEKILLSREEGFNPIINTLLNITDGIIGDVLGIKLICTFNTSLSKVDKALLRKGRLSVKYEFKKLKKEKVSKILGKDVDEDMCLADVYNIDEENDFSKTEKKKKMGFNQ